jgi:2TM domain
MEAAAGSEEERGTDNFFWPVFPILGWGIGVAANAWDVYGRKPITEDEIRREADRLRG